MSHTAQLRSRLQDPDTANHPETPHRPIPQRRTALPPGVGAVGTAEAFAGGEVTLVEADEAEGETAHG